MSDVSRHIPNYILVASGPMTHDALNITIYDKELEPAREQAMRHVKHLVKAGYYQFNLFQTGELDIWVESYNAQIPDPVVTVKVRDQ